MITDTPVRSYPLGEAAAHLVGYVQNVTAEDLEKHPARDIYQTGHREEAESKHCMKKN